MNSLMPSAERGIADIASSTQCRIWTPPPGPWEAGLWETGPWEATCEMSGDSCPALIINLSVRGAGFLCSRRFHQGTTLLLKWTKCSDFSPRKRYVRLIHIRAVGRGNWMIGAEFLNPFRKDQEDDLR